MKYKKIIRFLLLILIVLAIVLAFAQNTTPQIDYQNSFSASVMRPRHHACMARRETVISMDRFQEGLDLDKKIKNSNKLLYGVSK